MRLAQAGSAPTARRYERLLAEAPTLPRIALFTFCLRSNVHLIYVDRFANTELFSSVWWMEGNYYDQMTYSKK